MNTKHTMSLGWLSIFALLGACGACSSETTEPAPGSAPPPTSTDSYVVPVVPARTTSALIARTN